ncbi:Cofilin/tropomyosin-type actin-binding protein, partial [Ostertagia ostertagi]
MTVNFQKHGAALQSAYDRVISSKSNEEWAIFDYEGSSNVIKVGDEGDNGLEEFATSFNSGRLQYGVIGVRLSKNALPKIVLVHWQGEGVPSSRLVSATSHIDAVRRFLKMVHVTIYARSEIDIEPDVIRREVAKLPATASSPGQYQGDSDLDRHTPPQRRVVNSPSKLNSQRMEMFEKKDQTSPTPSSSFSHHDKKVDSPLPAISSTFSSSVTVSSLHNSSNSCFSAAPSPNDSGYEAGAS